MFPQLLLCPLLLLLSYVYGFSFSCFCVCLYGLSFKKKKAFDYGNFKYIQQQSRQDDNKPLYASHPASTIRKPGFCVPVPFVPVSVCVCVCVCVCTCIGIYVFSSVCCMVVYISCVQINFCLIRVKPLLSSEEPKLQMKCLIFFCFCRHVREW